MAIQTLHDCKGFSGLSLKVQSWTFQSINQSIIKGLIPLIFHAMVPQDIHTRLLLFSIWSLSILSHSAIISTIRFTTCIQSRKERFFQASQQLHCLWLGAKLLLELFRFIFIMFRIMPWPRIYDDGKEKSDWKNGQAMSLATGLLYNALHTAV